MLTPPRLFLQQRGGTFAHFRGREKLANREDTRLCEIAGRTLIGDGELAEPIDFVAPEVDANRMVGGRGIDVDDRSARRDLAARFDLVLPRVPDVDELLDEPVAVDPLAGRDHEI